MSTLSYALRRDTEFEMELGRAARALEALAPAGPPGLLEGELFGEFQSAPRRLVRSFTCTAADLVEVGRVVGRTVTRAELLAATEAAAGQAVRITERAAAALAIGRRTDSTRRLFCESFGVAPEFVPPWRAGLSGRVRWRDLGELVALRLQSAARILDGGQINYFCWIRTANCPECRRTNVFACSSFRGRYIICLGSGFWQEWRDRQTARMASTLLHEALHIYFGRTVAHRGRSSNASCYQRFALRRSGLAVRPVTTSRCPAGTCPTRPTNPPRPPRPAAPRVVDNFAHGSSALTAAHAVTIRALAQEIVASAPLASQVRLTGHADSSGPAAFNVTLGANRAQAVRRTLTAAVDQLRPGLSQRIRWIVESRGEGEPVAPNNTVAGRARNRRVQVTIGG